METNDLKPPQRVTATLAWHGAVLLVSEPPPPDFAGLGIGVSDGRPHLLYLDQCCIGEAVGFPRVTGSETFHYAEGEQRFRDFPLRREGEQRTAIETEVDCILNLPTTVGWQGPPEPVADSFSEMDGATLSVGASLIYGERQRQVDVEGYDAVHDDTHVLGSLRAAAMAYLLGPQGKDQAIPAVWPWESEAWKPEEQRIDNLVKAGALLAAEIDRLSRAGEVSKYSDSIEL